MPHWVMAFLIFLSSLVLFRINGKETIASMRIGQVVVMIGIASILVDPLKSKNVWISIYSGALLVAMSLVSTFIHIYFPKTKRWMTGQPMVLIQDGKVLHKNVKRARTTMDDLKMQLRAQQISDISMVKTGTLEIGGTLGIELYPEFAPATKKDIEDLKQALLLIGSQLNVRPVFSQPQQNPADNLFVQAEQVKDQDPLQ